MHYNPFAYIHSEKDILKLVTTLIANTKGDGKAGDEFWTKAETLLYCALIGYIHYEAPVEEQNFSTLIEFLNAMEVREDDEEFQNPVDLMFEALEKKKPNHFAVRQYKKYKLAAGVVCSKRLLNQAVGKSLRTHNLKPKKGAQVMRKNEKITALYERLSRDDFGKDDDQQRESNSISNQKAMLEEFAARQGFTNIVHFTDDGISGTCFDRPGFLAMMKEVEAGNVEYLCIKDMSRMGRDYLKVGQIMEILRQRGVRLIAINDGVDSARGDDDFTPFRNIMNEYYARDTSRKIRSTFQSKGKSGKHLTGTVIYGYLWNEARDQWLVDPEAADVVKRIFAMTIDGYGPYQIASKLKSEKVLIPSAYLAQHGEGVNKNKTFKDVYGWGSSTICNILEKREYLGHTINFKTRKHFKDKKSHYVPEDESRICRKRGVKKMTWWITDTSIGQRLKFVRRFRRLTQKELGLLMGYSEKTADVRIAQYEKNARTPNAETTAKLAEVLKVSPVVFSPTMLNQASDDRSILAQRLNISPHQLSYVTNSGEGEGLLFYGNVILPFIDRFPTDLELYRIMTTKLNEVAQEKEA